MSRKAKIRICSQCKSKQSSREAALRTNYAKRKTTKSGRKSKTKTMSFGDRTVWGEPLVMQKDEVEVAAEEVAKAIKNLMSLQTTMGYRSYREVARIVKANIGDRLLDEFILWFEDDDD